MPDLAQCLAALTVIRDFPIAEQDDMISAGMRAVARRALAGAEVEPVTPATAESPESLVGRTMIVEPCIERQTPAIEHHICAGDPAQVTEWLSGVSLYRVRYPDLPPTSAFLVARKHLRPCGDQA